MLLEKNRKSANCKSASLRKLQCVGVVCASCGMRKLWLLRVAVCASGVICKLQRVGAFAACEGVVACGGFTACGGDVALRSCGMWGSRSVLQVAVCGGAVVIKPVIHCVFLAYFIFLHFPQNIHYLKNAA